jgi:glycosyltransferase involved in cell wall biosynthesis
MDLPEDYLLSLGRWVPYKRHDLAIEVGARLGVPVVVAGAGPTEAALRSLAARLRASVSFVHAPSRADVRELLSRARCLLFPVEEDFGMIPVEAQAAGTPVVGIARGGLLETVRPGLTGELVDEPDVDALARAVDLVDRSSPAACRENAQRFTVPVFEAKIRQWVADA